jgi:hypothetical protein
MSVEEVLALERHLLRNLGLYVVLPLTRCSFLIRNLEKTIEELNQPAASVKPLIFK